MAETGDNSLNCLGEKINQLVALLKERNAEVESLSKEVQTLENEIKKVCAENVELQNKYNNLKIAKGVQSLSKGDISDAKKSISEMMRQIDVCIASINGM